MARESPVLSFATKHSPGLLFPKLRHEMYYSNFNSFSLQSFFNHNDFLASITVVSLHTVSLCFRLRNEKWLNVRVGDIIKLENKQFVAVSV